jgi:3-oxoacyl-[acyl-carrier protein] reductase
MEELRGKTAIVTGGSRGIGRAIVKMLAENGCHVAFNYLQSDQAAQELLTEVKRMGVKCSAKKVDIQDFEKVKVWIEEVKEAFGRLDILINNAGIIRDAALMLMSEEDWDAVLDTNLKGIFNASRNCIVTFLKQKSGCVINISSINADFGLARQINYSASKGGMNSFTKALAREVAGYGIRVNAVSPGLIETEIIQDVKDKYKDEILQRIPLGRIGQVADVANCVKFLLSKEASYITGQIIRVDGGFYME